MIKQILFQKAKSGIARDMFVKRCEESYVPLVLKLAPDLQGYKRNYMIPDSMVSLAHVGKALPEPEYDVVTEVWFKGEEQLNSFARAISDIASGNHLPANEAQLFDESKTRISKVDEYVEVVSAPPPILRPEGHKGAPAVTLIAMPKRKPGMSREAFIDRYESGHAVLGARTVVRGGYCLFGRYRRNYPLADAQRSSDSSGRDVPGTDIDVMAEFGFWTDADYQKFQEICSRPDIAPMLTKDEEQTFDRSDMMMFLAEPYASGLPQDR